MTHAFLSELMKTEWWETRRCKQISSTEPFYPKPSLIINPVRSIQVSQALQVSSFAGSETRGAFSPHRQRNLPLETRLSRMHSLSILEIHSSSAQKSYTPNLYTNNGNMIVTAHMVTSLAWRWSWKQLTSTSKRRAE